jgi:hypothetical protein
MRRFVSVSFLIVSLISNLKCQTISYDKKINYDVSNDLIIEKSGKTHFFSKIEKIIFNDSLVWFSFYNKNNLLVTSFIKNNELEKILIGIYNNPIITDLSLANSSRVQFNYLDTVIFEIIEKNGETHFFSKIQKIDFKDSLILVSFYNNENILINSFLKDKQLGKIVFGLSNIPIFKDANRLNSSKIEFLILDTAIFKNVYNNFENSPSYTTYSGFFIPSEKFNGFCAFAISLTSTILILNGYAIVPIIAIQPTLFLLYTVNKYYTKEKMYKLYLDEHHSKLIRLLDKIKRQND